MSAKKGVLKRNITTKECSWLKPGLKKGSVVYRYDKHTYGCIGNNGIAVSDEPNEEPFYEVPKDAVDWE